MKNEPHPRWWRRRGEVFASRAPVGVVCWGLFFSLGFPESVPAQDAVDSNESGAASSASEWTASDTKLANHYMLLLQQKPEYGNVLDLLWGLYEKRGQTEFLLSYLRSESANNGLLVAKILYGHLLRKSEQPEEARAVYEKVLELAPDNAIALKGAAEIADQQRRPDDAIRLYGALQPLVSIGTEEGVAILKRYATLLREAGHIDDAVAIWNALLVAWPGNIFLRTEIVGQLMEAGRADEAIAVLREIKAENDPGLRLTSLEILDQLYESINDFDGAVATLDEAMGLVHFKHHKHEALFGRFVRLHERFSRLAELKEQLQEPASQSRPSEKSVFLMAEFYRLTADPVNEEQWVKRLTEILPDHLEHQVRLVEIRMQNDHYVEAAALLDSLIASLNDPPLRLVLLRSRLALNLEGREAAESRLRTEMERRGTAPVNVLRKVLTFSRENYLDGMVEELLRDPRAEEIAGGGGSSAPAELARFLRERGRSDQAEKALFDYVEEAGASKTLRAVRLSEVSAVFRDLNLVDQASKCLDEAISLAPEQLEYRMAKADMLIDEKQVDEAITEFGEVWGKATDLKSRNEIDQRLFSLLRGIADDSDRRDRFSGSLSGMTQGGPIKSVAQYRRKAANLAFRNRESDDPPPQRLVNYYRDIIREANLHPSLENRYRAAWWAYKLQDAAEATHQLKSARAEAGENPVIEVEKLLLDLAELGEQHPSMAKQLETLARIDPENAAEYRHRRAEVRFLLGYEDEAVRTLEELARDPEVSLNTLKTLASVYQKQGRVKSQVKVWQDAYRRANLFEKRRIIKQLSTTLIELGQPEDALKAQLDLLRRETDSAQKRKQFDSQLSAANRHYLLTWLRDRYAEMAQQQPFDRFFPEALARIYQAAGDDEAAFLAMKRAYYMSGNDQELLAELGDMASRSKDLKAAIYYHRQLIAQDEEGASADSWESLIEMLERDLRVPEADLIRQRLEGKFAQDADFLKGLVRSYRVWGEIAAAERVAAKLTALRPWDAKSWLELGLLRKRRGENDGAAVAFENAIEQSRDAAFPVDEEGLQHPPLIRGGWEPATGTGMQGAGLELLADGLQDYPFLEEDVQEQLVSYLRSPKPEFDRVPSKKWAVRLRAIEEAGRIAGQTPKGREHWRVRWSDPAGHSPTERFWALAHAGERAAAYRILESHWSRATPVGKFVFCLLGLRLDRASEVVAWAQDSVMIAGKDGEVGLDRRVYPLVAGLQLMRKSSDYQMPTESIRRVFSQLSVSSAVAWHLFDRVRQEGSREAALELGRVFGSGPLANDGDFLFAVSKAAGRLGREDERRRWLGACLDGMVPNGYGNLPKSWFAAVSERLNDLESADEKQELVRKTIAKIDAHPAASEMMKQESRALLRLLLRDADAALAAIEQVVKSQLEMGRPDRRSLRGETFPGIQLWSLMERTLHEFAARRVPVLEPEKFYEALGGDPLAIPREEGTLGQYEQFEMMRLTWLLEDLSPPERHRRLQTFYSRLRDPSSKIELARTLDARGFHREAVPVFRAFLAENSEDLSALRGFFGACRQAQNYGPALVLIQAYMDGKLRTPPGMKEEYLIRNHAEFLLMARDIETLSARARGTPREEKKGEPKSRPTFFNARSAPLRALYYEALLKAHEYSGNSIAMLRVLKHLRDQETITKENRLRAARALIKEGKNEEAIHWLEGVKLDQQQSVSEMEVIRELAKLYASRENLVRADLVNLAEAALNYEDPELLRELAGILYKKGARTEARSCLLLQSRKNREFRGEHLSTLVRLELENGAAFEAVVSTLANLLEDLPGEPVVALDVIDLIHEFGHENPDGWQACLENYRNQPEVRVLSEIGLACLSGDWQIFDPGKSGWADSLSTAEVDLYLELVSRQEGSGAEAARRYVRRTSEPLSALFGGDPLKQVALLGRIQDSVRAAELHSVLLSEAASDFFHRSNARDVAPTFAQRWAVPAAFAEAGFDDLAGALFRRFREKMPRVTWEHAEFLESYARYLVARGQLNKAEEVLRPAFQKSIGADPKALVELYAARGSLDDLETLAKKWFLPSGAVLRVAEIRAEWERNETSIQ